MLIRSEEKEINFKLLFWGPACSGKTTCLNYLKQQFVPAKRPKKTAEIESPERTLFFDFLPLKVEKIKGLTAHFHLYTVPGQVPYQESRSLLLRGVDGVMMVLDSQIDRGRENEESLREIVTLLGAMGEKIADIPLVFAYNKQDLQNAVHVDDMNRLYNPNALDAFGTIACRGHHVLESFSVLLEKVIHHAKTKPL